VFSDFYDSYQNVINLVLINSVLGLSMWVVMSQNLISLAGAGFMSIGAYTSAILATEHGVPMPLCLLGAAALGGLVAYPLGRPVMRLEGHYFAITTLGFALVVVVVGVNWESLTGGTLGMFGIPAYLDTAGLLILLVSLCFAISWVARSHTGLVMYAIGGDPTVSRASGIHVERYRIGGFVVSGMLAGLAGALYAHQIRVLEPFVFSENLAFLILAFAILGGVRHWVGPVLGAFVLTTLPEFVRFFGEYRDIMTGLLLLLIVTQIPRGLVQPTHFRRFVHRALRRERRRPLDAASAPLPDVAGHQEVIAELGRISRISTVEAVAPNAPLLEARGITKHYGGVRALDGVSLMLEPGKIYGLIGPNGSGKSTFLNSVGGQVRPDEGTIAFDGEDVTRLRIDQRARLGLCRTFQDPRVDANLTVRRNVMVGAHWRRTTNIPFTTLGFGRARRETRELAERCDRLLQSLEMDSHADALGDELSFGQKRLVELARALLGAPQLLLLDEPTSGITPRLIVRLRAYFDALRAAGMTILLVEHNLPFVMSLCDHIFVLSDGRLIASGLPEELRNDAEVLEAYLGTRHDDEWTARPVEPA
jgi:branched-chain amino acid transport system ATP-binding protein/branched-chain amino acid transport system permease protein